LKASSLRTSENATPGRAGSPPLQLQLHVGAVVTGLEDAVLSSKSNSARDEIATTSRC
jgi:hypothetical protein